LETLKIKEYTFYPSIIGTKNFHYPDYESSGRILIDIDTLKFLPFICQKDRGLTAYQIPADLCVFLKLEIPVIWIAN
jgi:hypothetical protein